MAYYGLGLHQSVNPKRAHLVPGTSLIVHPYFGCRAGAADCGKGNRWSDCDYCEKRRPRPALTNRQPANL